MNSINSTAANIHAFYYAPMNSLSDHFAAELMIDSIDSIDDLIDAIDLDIRDLLHNANLESLLPNIDSLSDDEYDATSQFISSNSRDIAFSIAAIMRPPNA